MANHLVIAGVVGDEWNSIIQRAGRDPGVRGLDGTPLPARLPGNLRPFGAQIPACGKHDIASDMLGQLCPSNRSPVAFQRPPPNSARLINEMPSRRPVMWFRYRSARESPLKSIDTTSVSMIAAFIEKGLGRSLPGAMPGAWPRTHRPTHLRLMDAQVESRTPSQGRLLGMQQGRPARVFRNST